MRDIVPGVVTWSIRLLSPRDWVFVTEVAEWDPPRQVTFQVIEGYRVRTSIGVEPAEGGASRLLKLVTRNRENGDFRRLREALERPAVR